MSNKLYPLPTTAKALAQATGMPLGNMGGSFRRYQLYDYAFQPTHPQGWTTAISRDLKEADMFEAQSWLRQMAGGAYDSFTHYVPALRLIVYCERPQDAAMFKLAWGGDA